ncbi:hypothetical protein ASD54_12205 [Rhizobium sp. Root149]|uniref:hypothetical protein n=1 Tax=Rhizobium sp. Root149 TaxID=1736473 RepID=UPI000713197E|nr:hypothetical protein [Rhizobium sp. Root149]KQZ49694.1 hypothetical protein ASD54_12205 [Rhizobium sp. Root149]
MFSVGLLDIPKLATAAALGFLACYLVATIFWLPNARQEAVAGERAAVMARAIEIVKERGKNDVEIRNMPDGALCVELGGSWVRPDNICN